MRRLAYDITKTSMMLALALVLSILEAWLLPRGILPIPGFKLGLANIAILVTLYSVGKKEALLVAVLRSLVILFFRRKSYRIFILASRRDLCLGDDVSSLWKTSCLDLRRQYRRGSGSWHRADPGGALGNADSLCHYLSSVSGIGGVCRRRPDRLSDDPYRKSTRPYRK